MINYFKKNWKSILEFTFSLIIGAINFNLLMKPINLVSGGASGLALVLSNLVDISISNLITIIFIITFLFGLFLLDKKTVRSIILASIIYPILVKLTENIVNIIVLNYNDYLLITVIAGIISGIGNGLAFRNNYSTGGISVIALIMNKYLKISVSIASFICNGIIVILGGYFYGFNMVLYAIILLYISSFISNSIILGVSRNRMMFIRSSKSNKLIEYLKNQYQIKVTILENENKDDSTFIVVVDKRNYVAIKNELLEIDKGMFFTTDNCYEVGK